MIMMELVDTNRRFSSLAGWGSVSAKPCAEEFDRSG